MVDYQHPIYSKGLILVHLTCLEVLKDINSTTMLNHSLKIGVTVMIYKGKSIVRDF